MRQTKNMPSWVYWGLWGISSRKTAMVYLAVSALLAAIIVPEGYMMGRYMLCSILIAPLWYWLSMNWIDDNGTWESER